MKELNLSNAMLPLVAILAVLFPLATQFPSDKAGPTVTNPPPRVESQATALPKLTGQPFQAAALVCEFSTPEREKCQPFWRGEASSITKPAQIESLEFLLATLPDPQESSFNYIFDRYLEAIQRALEATGYTIDRYDLPWLKTGTDRKADQAAPSQTRAAREPGVILFRKSEKGKNSLLVLFLIGETPTAGIHQAALLNALNQTKRMSQGASTIRLLGPTFSGSATSLAITVRGWLESNASWKVNIISGSATGVDKADFLRRIHPPDMTDRVQFAATITPGISDLAVFINEYLLPGRSPNQLKIAMLRESNTTYGQGISSTNRQRQKLEVEQGLQKIEQDLQKIEQDPQKLEQERQNLQQELQKLKQEQQNLAVPILELPFPLHISKLRTAAEKANSEFAKKGSDADPTQRKNVPLRMDENKESADVVPMFSEVELASRELVLSDLLSTINRERINYLGLVASNVPDRIFLVREIRQHCPNVVIFTLGADILYLHPEARSEFRGLLMVTPYPLFNPNQLWTYPFKGVSNRLQFPLPNAQGTYNATLALFDRPELMLEYGSPFDSDLSPEHVRKPSLWVSVVGRDRLWPIKTLPYEDNQNYLYRAEANPESLPTYNAVIEQLQSASPAAPTNAGQAIATLPSIASGAFSSKASLLVL
jgi:hypothetical protein